LFYILQAEGPGVARKKKLKKRKKSLKKKNFEFSLAFVTPRLPMSVYKKFSPFGPAAVWLVIENGLNF